MEFSRQKCWSGLPCPSPGDLPNPGVKPGSPALQADSLPSTLGHMHVDILPDDFLSGNGDNPMPCEVFRNILILYSVATPLLPTVTTKNVSGHCQVSPGRQNCSQLGTTELEGHTHNTHTHAHTHTPLTIHLTQGSPQKGSKTASKSQDLPSGHQLTRANTVLLPGTVMQLPDSFLTNNSSNVNHPHPILQMRKLRLKRSEVTRHSY